MTGPTTNETPTSTTGWSGWARMWPRLVAGLFFALLVLTALTLFADVRQLGDALSGFRWPLLVPIILLTLANYGLRFVKWQIYLDRIGVHGLSTGHSLLTFLSAFSMSITPGKVGEVIKAVYVRRLTGTPLTRVAAVITAERLTDGLAMLGLAGLGIAQFSYGRWVLAAAALAGIAAIVILRRPALLAGVLAFAGRLPVIGPIATRMTGHADNFLDASNTLYAPRLVVGSVLLGIVSWFAECVALFLVLIGLGLEPSWHLLLVATFVLSVSSVLGALSLLPGGLGVAEASIAGLLILLITTPGFDRGDAAAATLIIRFATLWFAVVLGAGAVVALQRILRRSPSPSSVPDTASPHERTARP
ncbi:MAG TPA: lysylphosphatidylglycerol synthase transmembrane domain-containing protein [Thermomicrobiales bacterium]|jgi:uncharacterized protein (TIRG00374 family)|nr:lysylphosphatidylglycerol synthase transmembrane domain-containing protein [Thermomicrobiales bacterium]